MPTRRLGADQGLALASFARVHARTSASIYADSRHEYALSYRLLDYSRIPRDVLKRRRLCNSLLKGPLASTFDYAPVLASSGTAYIAAARLLAPSAASDIESTRSIL